MIPFFKVNVPNHFFLSKLMVKVGFLCSETGGEALAVGIAVGYVMCRAPTQCLVGRVGSEETCVL